MKALNVDGDDPFRRFNRIASKVCNFIARAIINNAVKYLICGICKKTQETSGGLKNFN